MSLIITQIALIILTIVIARLFYHIKRHDKRLDILFDTCVATREMITREPTSAEFLRAMKQLSSKEATE